MLHAGKGYPSSHWSAPKNKSSWNDVNIPDHRTHPHQGVLVGLVGWLLIRLDFCQPRYVFNHPIDFHFIADSVANWPKLHLQIFKLDACGRIEPLGG